MSLTDQEKRAAIAVALGWHDIRFSQVDPNDAIGIRPGGSQFSLAPDYLNSLDAMHEAEERIDGALTLIFWAQLQKVLEEEFQKSNHGMNWLCLHSTARQRAEAFGKTLNLW